MHDPLDDYSIPLHCRGCGEYFRERIGTVIEASTVPCPGCGSTLTTELYRDIARESKHESRRRLTEDRTTNPR